MKIINGKVYIDDHSLIRTDGHSVIVRDPTGTSLVIPVNVLNEVHEYVKKVMEEKDE